MYAQKIANAHVGNVCISEVEALAQASFSSVTSKRRGQGRAAWANAWRRRRDVRAKIAQTSSHGRRGTSGSSAKNAQDKAEIRLDVWNCMRNGQGEVNALRECVCIAGRVATSARLLTSATSSGRRPATRECRRVLIVRGVAASTAGQEPRMGDERGQR
jgi:hypothetical protein